MKNFDFKEADLEGEETLDILSGADKFNQWMYSTIEPFCNGEILEIGSGIGNISNLFLNNKYNITLSDIRKNYCARLNKEYGNHPNLRQVIHLDLIHPNFDQEYKELLETFNTVFALNVVEHIKDDHQAIANCKKLLASGGTLIILVPAYQALYNRFDEELFHYKRYVKSDLQKLFVENGIAEKKSKYFNLMGVFGWFFSGKILKKKTIPGDQLKIFNLLVPFFKILDLLTFNKVGLSVILVGNKPSKQMG